MAEPLPCPFCGHLPTVYEGNKFGKVQCENHQCPAWPTVRDGVDIGDGRGSDAYKQLAIHRWNNRWIPSRLPEDLMSREEELRLMVEEEELTVAECPELVGLETNGSDELEHKALHFGPQRTGLTSAEAARLATDDYFECGTCYHPVPVDQHNPTSAAWCHYCKSDQYP